MHASLAKNPAFLFPVSPFFLDYQVPASPPAPPQIWLLSPSSHQDQAQRTAASPKSSCKPYPTRLTGLTTKSPIPSHYPSSVLVTCPRCPLSPQILLPRSLALSFFFVTNPIPPTREGEAKSEPHKKGIARLWRGIITNVSFQPPTQFATRVETMARFLSQGLSVRLLVDLS